MTTALTVSLERAALVTEEAMQRQDVLVSEAEAPFVRETATGLAFAPDTPIEVWALLTVRLIVQHKRIEFALADAINFGRDAYGDLYAQWVQETGLNKRTLQNYARIGLLVEPARRRATMSFSHHEAVASLPPAEQESLLDAAEGAGMTRYELRDAVRERREQLRGRAVDASGAPIPDEPLCWRPTLEDLTDDARAALEAHAPGGRHRTGYVAGFLAALVWTDTVDAFKEVD